MTSKPFGRTRRKYLALFGLASAALWAVLLLGVQARHDQTLARPGLRIR